MNTNNQDPRNIFVDRRNEGTSNNTTTQQASGKATSAQQPNYNSNEARTAAQNAANNPEVQRKIDEMKQLAQKYQREGESQLVKDIVNNVIEQKAKGQLTNQQLMQFAKRVTPFLNAEQRQRLNGLVEQLLKL